jgi:flagellar biosynthesis protein FliP
MGAMERTGEHKRPGRGVKRRIIATVIAIMAAGALGAQEFPAGPGDSAERVPVPTSRPGAGLQGNASLPTGALPSIPFVDLRIRNPASGKETAFSIQLLLLLTVLSLAPSLIILLTGFLRISVVLDFVRRALSLQSSPPTQVIMGISLFLTVFTMWPVFDRINADALQPLSRGEIQVSEAYYAAERPLRAFMYAQMKQDPENIRLFMSMRGLDKPETLADVPTYVLIPAFILNELTIAFKIGILLFVPFIVIDMVVASVLMSMGMIMLPPVMISMPFKIILFVAMDGWNLLTREIMASFALM